LAFQIERNLDFDDYIHQRNLTQNCELWDPGNEPMVKPEPPRILQVELAPTKRKWSLSHEGVVHSQEPNLTEDFSLFIHQVGHPVSRVCEFTPFYVSLRVKDFVLRNYLLHPSATTNMMTEEVMHLIPFISNNCLDLTFAHLTMLGGIDRVP
jgi:hypothetical protein